MLVGYARCITIATGAMMAIGAYGATIPSVHGGMPFLAALDRHSVGALRGLDARQFPGFAFAATISR